MKFKHYNELNSKTRLSKGRPYVSISTKSGIIRFDTSAISALNLKVGAKVEFLQSEVDDQDWYIRINSPEGFSLKKSPNSSALQIQCTFLAKSIINSMSTQAMSSSYFSVRIQVASEMDPDANAYAMLTTQARTQV